MDKSSGHLVMFDGPDGVGKTTQFELAAKALQANGHEIFATHLLGGTEIGEALRTVMFSDANRPAITNLYTSLAIYYALADKVNEARAAGKFVLLDRSPLSLIAYQVYGDSLDEKIGFDACRQSLAAFNPDMVIIYQAPLETLQARRLSRQNHKATDYFENQRLAYHQRTLEGYEAAAKHFNVTTITADDTIENVHTATTKALQPLFT